MWRFLLVFVVLLGAGNFSTAASSEWNFCEAARNSKECLKKCSLDDTACQSRWLDQEVEEARKTLEAARASNGDYQAICKLAVRPKICDLCPQKTRECALEVLQLELNDASKLAHTKRELNRRAELTANPGYTDESLKRSDPRAPIDRRKHPEYNPIGLVQLPGASAKTFKGTGWLTSDCLVVTARHIITGSGELKEGSALGKRIKFLVGNPQSENLNFAYQTTGVVVASGAPGQSLSDDWALIRLDESIGKKVGTIETWQYSVEDALTCTALEVAGYPGTKAFDKLWWQTNCPLEKDISNEWHFLVRCPATAGNSGGPLLCRESNGDLRAIGIIATQSYGANARALNFTANWRTEIAPALRKYKNMCPAL